ncbi:hypothetical protein SD70_27915 [Gordoniibacillus kamchatkensis]|uniref:N-acetylmuramoyl-L-alanine amidase n=1 Tax=Gordoniibacillus kamchatkensis TaxID=1590651 RepID=A0ABR5AAY7_9BACL|nr:hypothetical protein [Paenibacillus sp. VKM B-2647]KIL38199.1 hypothetical protein SD70_27915 [Paenibacillus sp. VKM B-2647]
MPYAGVVFHHSVCPSINGKGYDFYVTTGGAVIPGFEPTSPDYIHVCVEGDFAAMPAPLPAERREQLFVVQKLLQALSERHGFAPADWQAHNDTCPGWRFPWGELVISHQDGYH